MNNKPFITILLAGISVSIANVQVYLSIFALILTIGYTGWRWYRDWKKTKNHDTKKRS